MIYYDSNNWIAPNRKIKAKVVFSRRATIEEEQELEFIGYITIGEYTEQDSIKSITINRDCEQGKLFGFGIFQKATVILVDKERTINEEELKKCHIDIYFCTDKNYIKSTPSFYVKDITRNENTNELTITGFDALANASNYTYADLCL
jgi:hypothetical protein